ncbi:cupin domain-containing protein [Aestuariicoccus sp. MJ-SS9]|uniref:cupin domain-containing protein n=1 Tax=Aestuariicoccus sp. MJ-SS9 TaxID=3079855 RepID=UPI00290CF80A|nr:cupin domain-containing protein [Aestuariicoccus sp. MJ-SS9]MDU8910143.1 cupin domain-containing protein [Aestuariicoccus sp. MJ-SS9]
MTLPDFIRAFPAIDLPLPESKVTTHAMRTDKGLAVFFCIHEDIELPEHSHGAQWGTVVEGSVTLTMNGETRTYGPGETYDIPAGTLHAVKVPAGSVLIDLFAEPDRYALKA